MRDVRIVSSANGFRAQCPDLQTGKGFFFRFLFVYFKLFFFKLVIFVAEILNCCFIIIFSCFCLFSQITINLPLLSFSSMPDLWSVCCDAFQRRKSRKNRQISDGKSKFLSLYRFFQIFSILEKTF